MNQVEFYSNLTDQELIRCKYQILNWSSKLPKHSIYAYVAEVRYGKWQKLIREELLRRGIKHC